MGSIQTHPSCYLARLIHFGMSLLSRFFARGFASAFGAILLVITAQIAAGAELRIPFVAGTHGEVIVLPVTVDKVEKLAGIKLAMTYDANIVKFIKATKTPYTSNMLHVVNDKVPGRLIIVMAAAQGFSGENVELVELSFELLKDIKKEAKVILQITGVELMGDDLKRIEVRLR